MTQDHDQETVPSKLGSVRRNLFLVAFILVVVAALALLPPYINGERYRHRIVTSMSQSLGRPVHLDKVTFHILPTPGITLGGLVVDENPAFGNEPVIRANVVEATLRLSSLWRRQIEISKLSFEVDENGSGPSVNVVRNKEGRWNLQDILTQAAHANTAPTDQRKAGPAPRFPYIEATGARVNLKLGDEKMPFSLTDADFALWLPQPQQWQIRLKAKPSRTDTNASDTGNMTLEGTLGRANALGDVPIHLTASWAHAPMGEATRVMTGDDQQWRGTLEAGATLTGTVGKATLETNVHLTDLRRADFVPSDLLDISAHCTAAANLTIVVLTEATCTIPNGGPHPITLTSASMDMQNPATAAATISVQQVPIDWAMSWARLFTQHIPDMKPGGTIDGTLTHDAGDNSLARWTGDISATLQSVTENEKINDFGGKPVIFDWRAITKPTMALQLQPVMVRPGGASQLTMTALVDATQYSVHVNGSATAAQIKSLGNSAITPLGDEAAETLKTPAETAIVPVDIDCTRPYSGAQSCTMNHAATLLPKPRRRR